MSGEYSADSVPPKTTERLLPPRNNRVFFNFPAHFSTNASISKIINLRAQNPSLVNRTYRDFTFVRVTINVLGIGVSDDWLLFGLITVINVVFWCRSLPLLHDGVESERFERTMYIDVVTCSEEEERNNDQYEAPVEQLAVVSLIA